MAYSINEKKALKKLKVNSFREISKDKVLDFMSMLPEMDPEVAKKALDQFPNYISFAKQTLGELKDSAVKAMEMNNKGFETVAKSRQTIIESLSKLLENDELTFDQKMEIAERMTELSDRMSKDYEKQQNFMRDAFEKVAITCIAGILTGASFLGFKGKFKS